MLRLLLVAISAAVLAAQTPILPLKDVHAGLRGTGKTVFADSRIEEFTVEILGVLENAGPKQSIILARLGGAPLERAGVMQGMSGSPVYVDGKLVGAVASAFQFAKEPVAGIRPIEEMLGANPEPRRAAIRWSPDGSHIAGLLPPSSPVRFGETSLRDIATPLTFGGFTAAAIDQFAPHLRSLGLEPRQGVLGGGRPSNPTAPARIEPGSMISVQLISGDLSMGADGTVTYVDGNRIYAFGHRFLSIGSTEIPFARSEVLTLLPNLATSFKISSAREWAGAITGDYTTGVSGELGRRPTLVPVAIAVNGTRKYTMNLVRDRLLTPFLSQVVTFAAIDATERVSGASTVTVRGSIDFGPGAAPARIDNVYSAENGAALGASLAAAIPLSYAMQTGFAELTPSRITLDIRTAGRRNEYRVDGLWTSRGHVHPGETIELHASLRADGGAELQQVIPYTVPIGAPAGVLTIQLTDAMSANLADLSQIIVASPTSASAAIHTINAIRPNNKAFLRILRPEPTYVAADRQLPGPPPSVAFVLRRSPASSAAGPAQSKIAEFEVSAGEYAVTGTRSIQIEVKEP